MSPGLCAIVEGPISEYDVGADGALGMVVVGRDARDVEECENLILVFEQSLGQTLPSFVGIDGGGEVEETVFEPSNSPGEEKPGIEGPPLDQTIGVGQ